MAIQYRHALQFRKGLFGENHMSIQYTNGFKAYTDGYARNANPVAYCLNGMYSAAQARMRDEWFEGWDAAKAAK
jgi:hypothetical protein